MKIVAREPLNKGWSTDRKYKVQLDDGRLCLLRIAERVAYEAKQTEFRLVQSLFDQGLPVAEPISFWADDQSVHTLYEWIEGEDLRDCAADLTSEQLYDYGYQAGQNLKKLHQLPLPPQENSWEEIYQAKIDRKLQAYTDCPLSYEGGQAMVDFVEQHRHLIAGRPMTYQHGDFHSGNMLLGTDGRLYLIDFDRHDIGDPWEEFNRLVWSVQTSPDLARGMVEGYFSGHIPDEFWTLLALYIAVNSLGSLPWAVEQNAKEVAIMQTQAQQILAWYDCFQTIYPSWSQSKK